VNNTAIGYLRFVVDVARIGRTVRRDTLHLSQRILHVVRLSGYLSKNKNKQKQNKTKHNLITQTKQKKERRTESSVRTASGSCGFCSVSRNDAATTRATTATPCSFVRSFRLRSARRVFFFSDTIKILISLGRLPLLASPIADRIERVNQPNEYQKYWGAVVLLDERVLLFS
jgi:hypothetical protein